MTQNSKKTTLSTNRDQKLDVDVIELLLKDHHELRGFLEELKKMGSEKSFEKKALFNSFKKLLDRHTYEEEQFLYHVIENNRDLRPNTLEGYEEHRLIGQLMKEMGELPFLEEGWATKFEVARELTVHHLAEEEEKLFPTVRKDLTQDKLMALAAKALESREKNSAVIG